MGITIRYGARCNECDYVCKTYQECNCCRWCCKKCKTSSGCYLCYDGFFYRNSGNKDCHPKGCKSQTQQCPDFNTCGCTCCLAKRPRAEVAAVTLSSPGAESQTRALSGTSSQNDFIDDLHEQDSTPSPPPYSAIAAIIVAIIVAIILLDLCIFRFPVGRNIRDFLVRKIPFCIAFYS
ncbi:hypothetical protein BBBOND_0312480 [Babesia bigemina]|uniref:Uncharacterized protein n=1 Tax=Babesia bigemina TaxID=5866 RepID=A0A061DEI6_BABBI|nr:hypothetical protein BBBOND_0312480 [Babesia bigemina]CDR97345.1 hypothetical protein BBBOND_0312480 [Babesia bigemina]|eukprot:XP_012769531.1 hypothetical protein BBBOND_0312480 [Babesia bigemina]